MLAGRWYGFEGSLPVCNEVEVNFDYWARWVASIAAELTSASFFSAHTINDIC